MISLEQIRQLDIRVKKAVAAVKALGSENTILKQRVAELEARIDGMRQEASDRKADEERLEVSLQGVLDVLDEVDGETAGIDPEPPSPGYVIPVAAWEDESVGQTGEEPSHGDVIEEEEFSSDAVEDVEDAASGDGLEVEDTADGFLENSEPDSGFSVNEEMEWVRRPTETDVAKESETESGGANSGESFIPVPEEGPDEAAAEDEPEEVELDSGEEDPEENEDPFQSEFDIF